MPGHAVQTTRRRVLWGGAALAAPSLAAAQPAKPVTIALSSNSFSTVPLRIAQRRGLFARHGIEARLVTMDNANGSIAAVIGGSAEVAASGPGEALAARTRGQDIVLIGNVYRGLSSVIVLSSKLAEASGVRPDAPLADRLRVLNGVTFASPSATAVFGISVIMALQAVGGRMRVTYMAQPAMPAALDNGAVQAMVAGSPFWVTAVARGAGVAWISGAAGELPPEVTPSSSALLQAKGSYAKANPAVVRGLRAVLDDIGRFVTDQPDEAKRALAAIYPDTDPKILDIGFDGEWRNWARPVVTIEDVRHDVQVLKASGLAFPGLDDVDPGSLLLPG